MDKPKVSIIMPFYNTEKYIKYALDSVIMQSYSDWECICINDCCTDSSRKIVDEYCNRDDRFVLLDMPNNSGAASARNMGIRVASGEYIAFLDADDIWISEKLEIQIRIMEENEYAITCTSYGKIDEHNTILPKICMAHHEYSLGDILKTCPGNSTVVYNCRIIGKIYAPNIKRRNDLALWISALRKAEYIIGIEQVLAYHRISSGTISGNKAKLVYYQYIVYRKIANIGVMESIYLIIYKVIQTIRNKNG